MELSIADQANQQMVDRLISEGALWSVPIIAAFRHTPRHCFLDRVFQFAQKSERWREMITRDPLKIPCLTPKYWATMEETTATQVAAALNMVRRNVAKKPLPQTSGLTLEEQLLLEERNVAASLAYARERLEF